MKHDRPVLLAILSDIVEIKSLWQLEIQLDRAALPRSADGILDMEVQLRSVKSTPRLSQVFREESFFQLTD